ncbi:MAG: hypothetical protein ACOYT4_00125 [Nanoarchaeota archaeon]
MDVIDRYVNLFSQKVPAEAIYQDGAKRNHFSLNEQKDDLSNQFIAEFYKFDGMFSFRSLSSWNKDNLGGEVEGLKFLTGVHVFLENKIELIPGYCVYGMRENSTIRSGFEFIYPVKFLEKREFSSTKPGYFADPPISELSLENWNNLFVEAFEAGKYYNGSIYPIVGKLQWKDQKQQIMSRIPFSSIENKNIMG